MTVGRALSCKPRSCFTALRCLVYLARVPPEPNRIPTARFSPTHAEHSGGSAFGIDLVHEALDFSGHCTRLGERHD